MTRYTLSRTSLHAGVLWGIVSIATGCTPTASGGGKPVTPGLRGDTREGPDPIGVQEGDSVPELEKRLERLRGEQAARMDDAMADTQACHDLCSLSASICEVQVKLCDIADRHPQEGSYQALCREGQQECQEAMSSCEDCVGEHAEDDAGPPVSAPPADDS
ncbi:MAG: hypothetical protein ACE37F_33960 [Nannocystaceae bacterium]|nr:hypothetical protein [bacterium]